MKVIRVDKEKPDNMELLREMVPQDILERDSVRLFGAADEEKAYLFGVAALAEEGGLIRILWLYVKEEYRRIGIAGTLLNWILDSISFLELDKPVEAYFPEDAAHSSLLGFFGAADNFSITKRPEIGRLTPEGRRASKFYASLLDRQANVISFFDLPVVAQKRFLNKMYRIKMAHLVEDVVGNRGGYAPELCCCTVKGQDVINAVFVKCHKDGEMELSFGYLEDAKLAFSMAAGLIQRIEAGYPESDMIVCAVNDASKKLMEGMFKDEIFWENLVEVRWNGLRMDEMRDLVEESSEF
ncbi:MAG: GNAT family N-acetyltransferase [Eubacteriales bacterium]|nr:GNAT family N-acetyltransferase [Eubacteriales bacterium]